MTIPRLGVGCILCPFNVTYGSIHLEGFWWPDYLYETTVVISSAFCSLPWYLGGVSI